MCVQIQADEEYVPRYGQLYKDEFIWEGYTVKVKLIPMKPSPIAAHLNLKNAV